MTHKHILPLTYKPKIQAVREGRCRQTIRAGRKFQVGDLVMFHGWEGKPYRSKWSFRTPWWKIHTSIWNVQIFKEGILFPEMTDWMDYSPEMFSPWMVLDWIAELDGIDPPTGEELGKVLLSMHRIPEEGFPAQIIRWNPEPLTGVE